jgi:hypothetical protein
MLLNAILNYSHWMAGVVFLSLATGQIFTELVLCVVTLYKDDILIFLHNVFCA